MADLVLRATADFPSRPAPTVKRFWGEAHRVEYVSATTLGVGRLALNPAGEETEMRAEGKELLLAGFFSFLAAGIVVLFWSGAGVPREEFAFRPGGPDVPRTRYSGVTAHIPPQRMPEAAVPRSWAWVNPAGNGQSLGGKEWTSNFDSRGLVPGAPISPAPTVSLDPPGFGPTLVPESLVEQRLFGPYGSNHGFQQGGVLPESSGDLSETTPEASQIDILNPEGMEGPGTPIFAMGPEEVAEASDRAAGESPSLTANLSGEEPAAEKEKVNIDSSSLETAALQPEVVQSGEAKGGESHTTTDDSSIPMGAEGQAWTQTGDHVSAGVSPAMPGQNGAAEDRGNNEGSGQEDVGSPRGLSPCPSEPIPGFRRCCEPRPGWVPPCGLLRYLRRLLECRAGRPLAEVICHHLGDLAEAVSQTSGSQVKGQSPTGPETAWEEAGFERSCCLLTGTCGVGSGEDTDDSDRAKQAIEELAALQEELFRTAERVGEGEEAVTLRRAGYALARRLPLWREVAAGNPFAHRVLQVVEEYEATGSSEQAANLAQLLAGKDSGNGALVHQLEQFFRNSNLRWEVSENLLNRWIQPQPVRSFRVRDVILGRPVIGESRSDTEARFTLVPDAGRLRCRLVITGRVISATQSLAGPAVFWDHSYGSFVGWKEIELTDQGLKISPPQVHADQRVELRGLRTQFDGIPLLGPLAQEVALSQRERSMPEAKAEARQKLIARIVHQFETEATPRLVRLQHLLERRLLQPARQLRLEPALVEAATYSDRLVARWRLAGQDQLGGHTPRPRVPEGSLASFQIHQSAVNNLLNRLELSDRAYTPAELRQQIADLLDSPELLESGEARNDVLIWFASPDPIQVTFDQGQLRIRLAVARLEKKPHVWRNFQVRVAYKPETINGETFLVRDGVITLTGESLSVKDQITLRGIFSKTFSKDRSWPVLPRWFRERPELTDVQLCHFVMDDGWFSWAVRGESEKGQSLPPAGTVRFATSASCPAK